MNNASVTRIVAFTKDWDDVPTCTTHILREMAKDMNVLWINSVGLRKPSLASGRDIGRIFRRLRSGLGRAVRKETNLRVLAPLLIPGARSAMALALNRFILGRLVGRELSEMGDGPVEYWCFVPTAVDFLPRRESRRSATRASWRRQPSLTSQSSTRGPSPEQSNSLGILCAGRDGVPPSAMSSQILTPSSSSVVYYCVDDWGKFENLDGGWLDEKEKALLARADIVFTPARYLERKCRGVVESGKREVESECAGSSIDALPRSTVRYTPHGVEYARFAAALDPSTRTPADIAELAKPIIGFYGNIYPWIDFGLVEQLARARPAWTFVMIGQIYCDVSRLQSLPNVCFPGRREHDLLPGYCRAFDAAIIPYDMKHPRMESVNPVKTKELLAAGVPVVAADVPELRGLSPHVRICSSTGAWLEALDEATRNKDRQAISRSVAGEDWGVKVKELRRLVERGVAGC